TALKFKTEGKVSLDLAHLILVQHTTIDIFHDENTERVFDVRGTRDIRYEIVKKRIDKGIDLETQERITQPGKLTIVYSTEEEWEEYQQYLQYLIRENWIKPEIEMGSVAPLPGVTGLKYSRVQVISD
ncbi:MAG: GAF domain-containing protein, partial [Cyanobacteriota bacterium]|nr:GAF domain-containing protein [Cyanobacteriota bacterium]